jgi:hypothetical protein
VRAAAAFALGVRGDPSAADKLVFVALDYHEADKDGLVRARALEAASKLERPELREHSLDGLLDSDARVRLESAQGASRWPTTEPNASAINQRLVDSLANEKNRDVVVYTLFALERRKAKEALDVFLRFAHSDDVGTATVRRAWPQGDPGPRTTGCVEPLWRANRRPGLASCERGSARLGTSEAVFGLGSRGRPKSRSHCSCDRRRVNRRTCAGVSGTHSEPISRKWWLIARARL